MRHKWFIFCLAALSLCSCGKQGPAAFRGYYSFKTGGAVDISGKVYDIRRDTLRIDTTITTIPIGDRTFSDTTYQYDIKRDTLGSHDTVFLRYLMAESGQMHILENGSSLVMTWNVTGGDPVVVPAYLSADKLVLYPTQRRVPVRVWQEDRATSDDRSINCYWTLTGEGRKLENMVLMDLSYAGTYSYDGFDGVVSSSHVTCIATENE